MASSNERLRELVLELRGGDEAMLAALARAPEPRALLEVRERLVAHVKAAGLADEPRYDEALDILNKNLRRPEAAPTVALEREFESARERYAALKAECEGAVVRWEWADGALHELEPFYFERFRQVRGRLLERAPRRPKPGMYAYGFDADNRIRVERQYTEVAPYETFFVHAVSTIASWRFHAEEEPLNTMLYRFEGGQIASSEMRSEVARGRDTYTREHDRITVIYCEGFNDDRGRRDVRYELSYDANGLLRAIEQVGVLARSSIWCRPGPGESLPELLPLIREHLLTLIPQKLAALQLEERVYALGLLVSAAAYDGPLPPFLAPALQSERQAWIAKHGREAEDYIWNPAEWSRYADPRLNLMDDRMRALTAPANQLISENEQDHLVLSMLEDVARTLNKQRLSLNTTDDFVVFALEIQDDNVKGAIRRSTTGGLLHQLLGYFSR